MLGPVHINGESSTKFFSNCIPVSEAGTGRFHCRLCSCRCRVMELIFLEPMSTCTPEVSMNYYLKRCQGLTGKTGYL